ncbi:MAG: hypothetical protein OHK0029_19360 [Armatimonadaceae bacterium]
MKQNYPRITATLTALGIAFLAAPTLPAFAQDKPKDPIPPIEKPAELDAPVYPKEEIMKNGILAVAKKNPNLSTFVRAVEAADLTDTLMMKGPFTVFAPTNEAFNALPEGTLEELLKPENKQRLVNILNYHIVRGKVMEDDLVKLGNNAVTKTVQGGDIIFVFPADNSGIRLNNIARVSKSNIDTANGVVHVIDRVLTLEPPVIAPTQTPGSTVSPSGTDTPTGTGTPTVPGTPTTPGTPTGPGGPTR